MGKFEKTGNTIMELDPDEIAKVESKESRIDDEPTQPEFESPENLQLGTILDSMGRFLTIPSEEFTIDLEDIPEPEGSSVGNARPLEDQFAYMQKMLSSVADEFEVAPDNPSASFDAQVKIADTSRALKHQIQQTQDRLSQLQSEEEKFRSAETYVSGEDLLKERGAEYMESIEALREERQAQRELILASSTTDILAEASKGADKGKQTELRELSKEIGSVKEAFKFFDGAEKEVEHLLDTIEQVIDNPSLQTKLKRRIAYEVNSNFGIADELALDTADRWILTAPLGKGGMGAVYKAEHLLLRRKDAVKFLESQGGAVGEESLKRFEQEGKAMAKFQDDGVAHVYDAGYVPQEGAWISMELVQGKSLEDQIQKGDPLPLEKIYTIAEQLAESISNAHQNNIIHRDIKPDNIIMDENNHITLIDFGIAKDIQGRKLAMIDSAYQKMMDEVGYEQMLQDWRSLKAQYRNKEFDKESKEFSTMNQYGQFIKYKKYNDLLQSTAVLEKAIEDLTNAYESGQFDKDSDEYKRLEFYQDVYAKQKRTHEIDKSIADESQRLSAVKKDSDEVLSPARLASERLGAFGTDLTKSYLIDAKFMGTPHYMSPEQAAGEIASEKSDVYSLGVVLYQISSGELPSKGNTILALFANIISEEPESVDVLNPDIPKGLSKLIDAMLAKDPQNRPSMDSVLRRIKRQMNGEDEKKKFASKEKQKSFIDRLWGRKK